MTPQEERLARENEGFQGEKQAMSLYKPPANLYAKLFELQSKVGKISKDSENPFFNSKYFDINKLIEHLHPHLKEIGLVIIQPIRNHCVVSSIIDPESGESIESSMKLPDDIEPQKMGSAVTYYRRYTLQSLLGLQADDDDDGNASKPQKKASKSTKKDDNKPWLNKDTKDWRNAEKKVKAGAVKPKDLRDHYKVSNDSMKYFESLKTEVPEVFDYE